MYLAVNFGAGLSLLYGKWLPKTMVNKHDYVDSVVQRSINMHHRLCWL